MTDNVAKAKRLYLKSQKLHHIWSKAYDEWDQFTHKELTPTEGKTFWRWYWEMGYKL